jgi:gluconokinase
MKANLLQSQFDALEVPTTAEAIHIDISQDVDAMVQEIKNYLKI